MKLGGECPARWGGRRCSTGWREGGGFGLCLWEKGGGLVGEVFERVGWEKGEGEAPLKREGEGVSEWREEEEAEGGGYGGGHGGGVIGKEV